mmetsp:Transcript_63535/g.187566  ORF Transcript_63535/g.187566 Transcript_63535/m.187566 type:complete len:214 (+) Transcript_63535:339-980(+)
MCSTPRCSPAFAFSRAASSALTIGGGNEEIKNGRTGASFLSFSPESSFIKVSTCTSLLARFGGKDSCPLSVCILNRISAIVSAFRLSPSFLASSPARRLERASMCWAFLALFRGKYFSPPSVNIWDRISSIVSPAGPCWLRRFSFPSRAQCDTKGTCCDRSCSSSLMVFFFCCLGFFVVIVLEEHPLLPFANETSPISIAFVDCRDWHPPLQT